MGDRPITYEKVEEKFLTPAASAAPSANRVTEGWNIGDVLLEGINLYVRTKVSAAGALVAEGRLRHLRGLLLNVGKYGTVVENYDGHALLIAATILNSWSRGAYWDANQDGILNVRLPLAFKGDEFYGDCRLDLLKNKPDLTLNWGPASDIETTGGTTLSNLDYSITTESYQGPILDADLPEFMPFYGLTSKDVTGSGKQTFTLDYGDRIIDSLAVQQYNTSTKAPLNNTVIGVATTDKVDLKINNFAFVSDYPWNALQARNRCEYNQYDALLGSYGVGIFDFKKFRSAGCRVAEGLPNLSRDTGRITFTADCTLVSNAALKFLTIGRKPIPDLAKRAVQSK